MVELERFECRRAHEEHKIFILGNLHVQNLTPNSTIDQSIMLAGRGGHDGTECSPTTYHDAFGSWSNVVVTATVKIPIEDYEASVHLTTGKVILKSGVRCELGSEYCIDRDGAVVYWEAIKRGECAEKGYTILYQGVVNETIEKGSESHPLYSIDTLDIVIAFTHKGTYDVCLHKFIRTDHPKLLIVEIRDGEELRFNTQISADNLDLMTYVNSKFIYVEKRIRRHFNSLYRDVLEKRCNLERKVLGNTLSIVAQNPDEFALRLKGRPGYIGIVAGEVIYVAKCIPVIVQQREATDCYNELPVSRNGEPMFLTARSRILTRMGVKLICDEKLPTVYRIGKQYIKFLPIREVADAPTILTPETEARFSYEESKYISRGGIYTEKDTEKIRERAMFPIEQKAFLDVLVRGVLGQNVSNEIDMGAIIKPEYVNEAVGNFLGRVWGIFQLFGVTSAGFIAVFLIAKIIKFGLDTVIHGIALHEINGFSFHLIGAIWDSLTQLLLHWGGSQDKKLGRNESEGNDATDASKP